MYKFIVAVLLIVSLCEGIPVHNEDYDHGDLVRADRIARATCDLLSASVKGVTLNHSACAAHCLVLGKGFRGGRCIDGVCHCRK